MNVKIRNKFIEIKYSVSNGLIVSNETIYMYQLSFVFRLSLTYCSIYLG